MAVKLGKAPSEPVEIALPHDVRVWVRLDDPAADIAAMRAQASVLRDGKDEDAALSAYALELARRCIVRWEGVEDDSGPAECTPENVEALMHMPGMLAAFYAGWLAALSAWRQEGNG